MKNLTKENIKDMIIGGTKLLELNRELVDSLNVFPVPDGDTGTNMSMTLATATREALAKDHKHIDDIFRDYAHGALKGARGNSGVIMSQIIKGLSDVIIENKGEITTKVLGKAFQRATDIAYDAVTKPKEGTILTVIRALADAAVNISLRTSNFDTFFKHVLQKGEEMLDKTPDMLPILKQAGVVDAGGKGLLFVIKGYHNALMGIKIESVIEDSYSKIETEINLNTDYSSNDAIINSLGEIEFGYCTEYFVININKSATEEDINKLRNKLLKIGDSVICIGDLDLIKVHVHTNDPNKALKFALDLGELDKIKIENMREQNRQLLSSKKKQVEKLPVAVLTICVGEGIKEVFKDLQIEDIIEGGQTMNPSVENILSVIEDINSNNVIILPNNKNIFLAASQASKLTKKKCYIVESVNIAQGIRAAVSYDPSQSAKSNFEIMSEVIKEIKFGQITTAVRSTKIDNIELKEGDIIGINEKQIATKGKSPEEVCEKLLKEIIDEDTTTLNIYYGDLVEKEKAEQLFDKIQNIYDEVDVMLYYGGQPHYHYLLSVE